MRLVCRKSRLACRCSSLFLPAKIQHRDTPCQVFHGLFLFCCHSYQPFNYYNTLTNNHLQQMLKMTANNFQLSVVDKRLTEKSK